MGSSRIREPIVKPCYRCDKAPVGVLRIRGLLLELPICDAHAKDIERLTHLRIDYSENR